MQAQEPQPPGQLCKRPSPDAVERGQSQWVTAQTSLIAVGHCPEAEPSRSLSRELRPPRSPPRPRTLPVRAPIAVAGMRTGALLQQRRFPAPIPARSLCRTYFRSVSKFLQRPCTYPARSLSRAYFRCAWLWCKRLSAHLPCVVLLRTCLPSACSGYVAPGGVGLGLSFPLCRMRVVLHASLERSSKSSSLRIDIKFGHIVKPPGCCLSKCYLT